MPESRNQREGRYCGFASGYHVRAKRKGRKPSVLLARWVRFVRAIGNVVVLRARLPGWRVSMGNAVSRHKPPSITCPTCGLTSYHPRDIAERYCARCAAWHSEDLS